MFDKFVVQKVDIYQVVIAWFSYFFPLRKGRLGDLIIQPRAAGDEADTSIASNLSRG